MNLRNFVRRLQNTEEGQIQTVFGLFGILFLMVLGMFEFQVTAYRASSDYLEDALAGSGLASAVIDVREYGISHRLIIPDLQEAYDRYLTALKTNLRLRADGTSELSGLVAGEVKVVCYEIYNVDEVQGTVECLRMEDGRSSRREGMLGDLRAPNGQIVESTGVYSEIEYAMDGFFGVRSIARKGKLVEVKRL